MTFSPCMIFVYMALVIVGGVSSVNEEQDYCVEPKWFRCNDRRCISKLLVCDGNDDCGDNSDEQNCPDKPHEKKHNISCSMHQYKCKDNTCIPVEDFCNRIYDCPDKSDEYVGCTKQKNCSEFRCNNGYCVMKKWICDGFNDCGDSSDEKDCDEQPIAPEKCNSGMNRFLCKHGRCIPLSGTCNGKDDCSDNSDEDEVSCRKAEEQCTKGIGCSHYCKKTPKGAVCWCPPGYRLVNNRTCTDIDECSENPELCGQRCINNAGSYACICEIGYRLQRDQRTCRADDGADALLVFSTKSQIRGLYLRSEAYFPIADNLQHALGVSIDSTYVYWSDMKNSNEAIVRSDLEGNHREIIATAGLGLPEDIAVDWVTGNLYFTDGILRHIGVCKGDGEYCTVIITESMDKPRGLALYPLGGEVYWTDFGKKPHISRAGMDGKNVTQLVTENLGWPNGLTIDYPNRRLYWVDAKRGMIESIGLDGKDRRHVLDTLESHPYSIAIFEDTLYWSDWNTKTIQSAQKYSGKNRMTLIREVEVVYGIHIYQSILKPRLPNPCNTKPCAQLCLLGLNNTYSCACTLEAELGKDQRSCIPLENTQNLMISSDNTLIQYFHHTIGKPKIAGSLTLKRISHLAYDPIVGSVIANDQATNTLFRFNPLTEDTQFIVNTNTRFLGGLDFDYYGNNIYWSDRQHRTINIYSVKTGEKTIFHVTEEPLDILVIPKHAAIYVVFRSGDKYEIDKLNMTGTGEREHIIENLKGPKISLAYDAEYDRIFWSEESTGKIEKLNVQKNNRTLFRTGLRGPVSLAIVGDEVFWSLRDSKLLQWANKNNRIRGVKGFILQVGGSVEIMYLATTGRPDSGKKHPCRVDNGGCSHICLVAASNRSMCACPPGMKLDAAKRTCSHQTSCAFNEIRCSGTNECINENRRCNGIQDCPNGEDEARCMHIKTCKADEFMCRSGDCINLKKHCDSVFDCQDKSDETHCGMKACKYGEFQCSDGRCITKFHVCDGRNDCDDFSDETDCQTHTCGEDSWRCSSGACIPKSWKCDGEDDCVDSSDEASENCEIHRCPRAMFQCENKRCVDQKLTCDSVDDCDDNSDEVGCINQVNADGQCDDDAYNCHGTKKCIPLDLRCNGEQDCPKNDDEHHCSECGSEEFACDSGKCIDYSWVCDEVNDCDDRSDEANCEGLVHGRVGNIHIPGSVDCDEFTCKIGTCVEYAQVCDGIFDCFDATDEGGDCSTACTAVHKCKVGCQQTPSGPLCLCGKGYKLHTDGISCVDTDECTTNICPQICHNQVGSYTCSCFDDFILRSDRISCKASGETMEFITATKSDIRRIPSNFTVIDVMHYQPNVDVTGLDVDMGRKLIYWSNELLGTVNRMDTVTYDYKTISGHGEPGVLAIDWSTDNVYFHDGGAKSTIKICNFEREKCARILQIPAPAKLMSIAVDPKNGLLFWGETTFKNFEDPKGGIYRADMSGANRTSIAQVRVGIVSGIAIDHRRSHLYWADAHLHIIERSNLDGSDRRIFLQQQVFQPISLNIHEDFIYWLVGTSGVLKKCPLYGYESCATVHLNSSNVNQIFVISQISRQPHVANPCENHKCDYMCVKSSHGHTCICPNGVVTKLNGTCGSNTTDANHEEFGTSDGSKTDDDESNPRSKTPFFVIIAAVLLTIMAASCCYFYRESIFGDCNVRDACLRFRNRFHRRSSPAVSTADFEVPGLVPGDHEYVNPMIDVQQSTVRRSSTAGRRIFVASDESENELEVLPPSESLVF